jgi:hypothetical protein
MPENEQDAERVEAYKCPKSHVIPATRQFYAWDFSEGLKDADGVPMFESGLWCSCCEQAYGLSRLVQMPGLSEGTAAVIHDVQLARYVAQNPTPA